MKPKTLYKLTDRNNRTYGGCQWGEGVTHETSGKGNLCGPGWLHAYAHPLLAVLLNPIHADFNDPVLWECEGGGKFKTDHGLKIGCTRLTTIRWVPLPVVTADQRVRFAILCAKQVCTDRAWNAWADKWLRGEDRSAAWAAREAALAARVAEAAWAARAAALAALAARVAEAAWAARAAEAAVAAKDINLVEIAEEACR